MGDMLTWIGTWKIQKMHSPLCKNRLTIFLTPVTLGWSAQLGRLFPRLRWVHGSSPGSSWTWKGPPGTSRQPCSRCWWRHRNLSSPYPSAPLPPCSPWKWTLPLPHTRPLRSWTRPDHHHSRRWKKDTSYFIKLKIFTNRQIHILTFFQALRWPNISLQTNKV